MVDTTNIVTNDKEEKEKLIEEGIVPPTSNEEVVVVDVPPDGIVTNIEEVIESVAPVVEELPAPVVVDPSASVIPPPLLTADAEVSVPPSSEVPEKFRAAIMRLGELELGAHKDPFAQYIDYEGFYQTGGELSLKVPVAVLTTFLQTLTPKAEEPVVEEASPEPKTYEEFKNLVKGV
jgi:hypothetical protein